MSIMNDMIRLPSELGDAVQQHRKAAGMSVTDVAKRSGKTRDVVYRIEQGEDVAVTSLMAVLGALGLALRLEKSGMPTLKDVQARFAEDDDDDAA
ncbi:MAG: helix-turn-helix transcriptional regulator [Aquabacterium sp.]